jgi:hypothetical protein
MASALYAKGKAHLLGLSTKVDLVADNIKVALIDTGTETFGSTDEFMSDITSGGDVARSGNLSGKTVTSGTFDANDITITAVTGATVEAVVLYKDSGSDASSPLIAWFDLASAFTPNGSDVTVTFNASGIFAI